MEKVLIYRSLGEELQDNELSRDELRKQYEVTDDGFVRNVRAFIRNSSGEIAMLFEPRYNRYATPGGKVDKGESDEDAIKKEIYEELGVGVKSIEWIGSRKSYMRGSKGIYKWFARYCYVEIDGVPEAIEKDKATELQYIGISLLDGQTIFNLNGDIIKDKNIIYDRFPGIHTLTDVLPYIPSDPIEGATIPFSIPTDIDPKKTYIQRYIPEEKQYIVEEDI